jgi:hypothetical protein
VRGHLLLRAFTVTGGALALVVLLVFGASGGADLQRVQTLPISQALLAPEPPQPPPPPGMTPGTQDLLEEEPRTAIQGDEISNAVATYGIDDAGNLYEVHSPHTEVPSLGGPTT